MAINDASCSKSCQTKRSTPIITLWVVLFILLDRVAHVFWLQHILKPIAMSHMRKRAASGYYKTVSQYRDDWRLMFNNARTYNTVSWLYSPVDVF